MSYNHTGSPETLAYIKGLERRIEVLESENADLLASPMSEELIDILRARVRSIQEQLATYDDVIQHYEAALKSVFTTGASGPAFSHWNTARIALAKIKETT